MVRLVYFAWVRERVGCDAEEVEPPPAVTDVSGLVEWLAGRGGGYAAAFSDPARLRAAIDHEFVPLGAPIAGAREIALFPPVTGG